MKKFLKILAFSLGSLLFLAIITLVVIWIKSPGKAQPIKDTNGNIIPGSISTIESITLGGLEQYVIIRGADTTKPVMLFLHGGPGSPEIAIMRQMNPDLEKEFIVIHWEQRGAGKSYSRGIPAESINMDQFISDTREISEILINRFNKDRIYLAGHSWGSLLGILTAEKYPELYHSFIGIGQVSHQYQGEKVSFEWVKEQAKADGDRKAMKKLGELSFPDSLDGKEKWLNYLMTERKYVNHYGGGITRDLKGMWPVIKMVLNAKEYSLKDKIYFGPANTFSLGNMWSNITSINLFNDIDSMKVPVYIFQGKYDYQTPYIVAKAFYEQLKAPAKGFYVFEEAAHSPIYEDPDRFNKILIEEVIR